MSLSFIFIDNIKEAIEKGNERKGKNIINRKLSNMNNRDIVFVLFEFILELYLKMFKIKYNLYISVYKLLFSNSLVKNEYYKFPLFYTLYVL